MRYSSEKVLQYLVDLSNTSAACILRFSFPFPGTKLFYKILNVAQSGPSGVECMPSASITDDAMSGMLFSTQLCHIIE